MRDDVEEFNRLYPIGTGVIYHPVIDEQEGLHTKTRSAAWNLSNGEAMVLVEGMSGGVSLTALSLATSDTPSFEEAKKFVTEWLWDPRPFQQTRYSTDMPWPREFVTDAAQMIQAFVMGIKK